MKKVCSKCEKLKDSSSFYKDKSKKDGLASTCKECSDARTNAWIELNRERTNANHSTWLKANPDGKRASNKTWVKSNPERVSERDKSYRDKWPEKFHARQAVKYALKIGKIIRQPCEVCGEPKTHAHHDDYSKQLDVRWLCRKHHDQLHIEQHN